MTVIKVVSGLASTGEVFEFSMSPTGTAAHKQSYSLAPGTVIVCEESDVIQGVSDQYLQALGLFFVKNVPEETQAPTLPYLYSTATLHIGEPPAVHSQANLVHVTHHVATCSLCVLDPNGPATPAVVQLAKDAKIVAKVEDYDPQTNSIKANTLFFVDRDATHTEGPYVFTEDAIPLNALEEDEENSNT